MFLFHLSWRLLRPRTWLMDPLWPMIDTNGPIRTPLSAYLHLGTARFGPCHSPRGSRTQASIAFLIKYTGKFRRHKDIKLTKSFLVAIKGSCVGFIFFSSSTSLDTSFSQPNSLTFHKPSQLLKMSNIVRPLCAPHVHKS